MRILDVPARAGDWVEVKSAGEILDTLDERGELDAVPFMPEMLQYCGKRFRVYKSAHKGCDTLETHKNRSIRDAVHLEGLRCDGSAHGGCQALCLLYWKTSWLRPVPGPDGPAAARQVTNTPDARRSASCTLAALNDGTRADDIDGRPRYRCQATEWSRASAPLLWWDPRQYARDLLSGNVGFFQLITYGLLAAVNIVMRLHWRLRPYPYVCGTSPRPTPKADLGLQPGELVQVRSRKEIMATLEDGGNRNRGLSFDVEMVPYCDRTFRVLRRVDRIVDEKNGRLITFPNPCIVLDGVTCSGNFSRDRLFCPRAIYPYWHEVWLRRVS